jgi:hypothetical protein
VPHLGDIRLDRLSVDHVGAMFAAIAERNEQIRNARDSDDPQVRASVKGKRVVGLSSMHRIRRFCGATQGLAGLTCRCCSW